MSFSVKTGFVFLPDNLEVRFLPSLTILKKGAIAVSDPLSYIMRERLSYPKECVSVSLIFEFSHIFFEIQECVSVIILRKR